jgi:hypothetical protein
MPSSFSSGCVPTARTRAPVSRTWSPKRWPSVRKSSAIAAAGASPWSTRTSCTRDHRGGPGPQRPGHRPAQARISRFAGRLPAARGDPRPPLGGAVRRCALRPGSPTSSGSPPTKGSFGLHRRPLRVARSGEPRRSTARRIPHIRSAAPTGTSGRRRSTPRPPVDRSNPARARGPARPARLTRPVRARVPTTGLLLP